MVQVNTRKKMFTCFALISRNRGSKPQKILIFQQNRQILMLTLLNLTTLLLLSQENTTKCYFPGLLQILCLRKHVLQMYNVSSLSFTGINRPSYSSVLSYQAFEYK